MARFHSLTGRTCRFVIACAVVAAVAVSLETVLLAALRAPDASAAAASWARHLGDRDLQEAALRIQTYPYFYRRAIMSALEPEERAQVWRRYLANYIANHNELAVPARALIARAASAMTPDVFDDNPPADHVAELANIFDVSVTMLGRRTATDLFMRLGPDDGGYESLPIAERVTNIVRDWITLHARSADCECSSQFSTSCDVGGATGDTCTDTSSCEPVISWPMCGVAWAAPCGGVCTTAHRKR